MLKVKILPARRKAKKPTKPLESGTITGIVAEVAALPNQGAVKRYIVTSAQNNTPVHKELWQNILAFAAYHKAEIFVGTFTYNLNAFGEMSVKKGSYKGGDRGLKYAAEIKDFEKDTRIQLGKGLVWCGEANILPTAANPLTGFETYEGRNSVIFPQATIAMRPVASLGGSGSKLLYSTGTVTMRNYINKKTGNIAEFRHTYGGLIVEVDSEGVWRVRQLDAESKTGTFYDLDIKVENGEVTTGHRIEALVPGDIHATAIDPTVLELTATGKDNMIDALRPKYVFIHDLIEGASVNHHQKKEPLERYKTEGRGLTVIQQELQASADILKKYYRPDTQLVVVNSNHDRWLDRWASEYDPRTDDIRNWKLWHAVCNAQIAAEDACAVGQGKSLNVLEYILRSHTDFNCPAKFLAQDEPFFVTPKKIDCGRHGDRGPNGSRGSLKSLSKVGRLKVIAHSHVAGICDGTYQAGTSTRLDMGYNHGESSWTHSHVIIYPNGKRSIVTMYENKWRA